ncbi:uncharacterized protein LOC132194699 [Neocloeon triangulifer]|uniref:uncharacterized protein LOC132194699 n=1 Tax=Neocloeon triangulifer TaxID=2078957 RepID=UPI00286F7043|nr:uncharacterized protein LOC132194699 [Neocloeon triangulifer]
MEKNGADIIFLQERKTPKKSAKPAVPKIKKSNTAETATPAAPKPPRKYTKRPKATSDVPLQGKKTKLPKSTYKYPKSSLGPYFAPESYFYNGYRNAYLNFLLPSSSSNDMPDVYNGRLRRPVEFPPLPMSGNRSLLMQQNFVRDLPFNPGNTCDCLLPPPPVYYANYTPKVTRSSTSANGKAFSSQYPKIFEETEDYKKTLEGLLDLDADGGHELWREGELEDMLFHHGLDSNSKTNLTTPSFEEMFELENIELEDF